MNASDAPNDSIETDAFLIDPPPKKPKVILAIEYAMEALKEISLMPLDQAEKMKDRATRSLQFLEMLRDAPDDGE